MSKAVDKIDISKHSKKNLLVLLKAYQQAIDESVISSITDPQGTILYINKKFCEVSKFSENELLGQNHNMINSGHHPKEFFAAMWKCIASGSVWHGEVKNVAKDGSHYWVDTVIIPIKKEERIIQFLSLRMLITEKKEAVVERGEHIKSLEEMLSMTSHKVRKPISTFLGLMELIDTDKQLEKPEQKLILQYAKDTAMELDSFTRELTTFIYETKEKSRMKNVHDAARVK